jgi:hypothetical protein
MVLCAIPMVNTVLTRQRAARATQDWAESATFHGVRRQDWRDCPRAALNLGRKLARRGEIAYWVASPEELLPEGKPAEQRGGPRTATRLRSAKLLDEAYRFVCECRICNRSLTGLRLALARETGEVRGANVVWRRGPTIGIRLQEAASANALRPSDRYALRERYYAILS